MKRCLLAVFFSLFSTTHPSGPAQPCDLGGNNVGNDGDFPINLPKRTPFNLQRSCAIWEMSIRPIAFWFKALPQPDFVKPFSIPIEGFDTPSVAVTKILQLIVFYSGHADNGDCICVEAIFPSPNSKTWWKPLRRRFGSLFSTAAAREASPESKVHVLRRTLKSVPETGSKRKDSRSSPPAPPGRTVTNRTAFGAHFSATT